MALYLGSEKVKIKLGSSARIIELYSNIPITTGVILLSSDGYILRDSNGLYVTSLKESE